MVMAKMQVPPDEAAYSAARKTYDDIDRIGIRISELAGRRAGDATPHPIFAGCRVEAENLAILHTARLSSATPRGDTPTRRSL
jgi:hypothetical protein